MLKGLFGSSLRKELEEIRHGHRLQMQELNAKTELEKKAWEQEKSFLEKNLKQNHELKTREAVTLVKLDSEERIKQAELSFEAKHNQKVMELEKDFNDRLKNALTKLHEEGNVTTNFVKDLALNMFSHVPETRTQTKIMLAAPEKA